MINPIAIVYLDNAEVDTADGREDGVFRIAVWDWQEFDDDGTATMKLHTNNGDVYVDKDDVRDIDEFTSSHTLEHGHVVSLGGEYTMDYDNRQLEIPEGTQLTVSAIRYAPDGPHIEFDCEFPDDSGPLNQERFQEIPTTIYAFAMDNLLEDGGMSQGH
ncbi:MULTISPECIES: hypothetical protein [Haloferacaceae]|uniref:Uncharacterized protein n=2 Tax=Haloferacaceae TaxID=1644056 RepID=A0ABD6DB77_9EURY|nr:MULTISPECIES: hypothetical protein [Halorubraceae]CDK38167.1 hypothetical protein BN903_367 [Halorubrum sp. AJ67]